MGQKTLFSVCLKNGKKMDGIYSRYIPSRLVHISDTEGLNKSKSINQSPGLMPRLKVGREGKKGFSLQQSLGAVRNEN